jgi:hypothetical protein
MKLPGICRLWRHSNCWLISAFSGEMTKPAPREREDGDLEAERLAGAGRADEQNGLASQRGEHDLQLRGAESLEPQKPQRGAEGLVQGR